MSTQSPTSKRLSKTLLGRINTIDRPQSTYDARRFIPVAAEDLAQRVTDELRVVADERNVELLTHVLCRPVWVQPNAFLRALYELLENAIRASRRGYPVVLDAHETREGDVLWQVEDLGEGMSSETLADLGHRPTTAGDRGFGIARAWSVIDDHMGLLRFESALGVGTTASIWLPAVGGLGLDDLYEIRELMGDL